MGNDFFTYLMSHVTFVSLELEKHLSKHGLYEKHFEGKDA